MALVAMLDGDILTYRVGFTTMDEPLPIAKARMNTLIDSIMDALEADEFKVALSPTDKSNFRYKVYPDYKSNRRLKDKPVWYHHLREFLIEDYGAELAVESEADDLLGIWQRDNSVIVTIDKDLNQIPGDHYNFVKEERYDVSEDAAMRFFYYQLLVGDTSDNIPGCYGIGPVAATKLLGKVETEDQMQRVCLDLYRRKYLRDGMSKMIQYGQCLRIKRTEEEGLWQPEYVLEDIEKVGIKKAPWRDW